MTYRSFSSLCALTVFILSTANLVVYSQPSQTPMELIRRSIEISSHLPYQGAFSYSKQTTDGDWSVSGNAIRLANGDKLVVVETPEILEGIRVIQTSGAIWATTNEDSEYGENIDSIIKPIAWYWVMRNGETISFDDIDLLADNYRLRPQRNETVANRETLPIHVTPKYKYRPRANVWIDSESGRQLKYERFDPDGAVMEAFEFTQFEPIADSDKPGNWTLEGLIKIIDLHVSDEDEQDELKPLIQLYQPKKLPPGFTLKTHSTWDGRFGRVTRLLYSDGLALFSLFQRQLREEDQVESLETESVGKRDKYSIKMYMRHGRAVYFRDIDDVRISAVGDTDRCEIIDALTSLEPMKSPLPEDLTASR